MNIPFIPVLLISHLVAAVLGAAGTRALVINKNRDTNRGVVFGSTVGLVGGLIALFLFWLFVAFLVTTRTQAHLEAGTEPPLVQLKIRLPDWAPKNISFRRILLRLRAFIALILLFGFFSIYSPDAFLKSDNLVILTKQVALNAIMGIGMTFVILTAGIDLSIGSIVGLCGMVAGALIREGVRIEAFDMVIYWNVWILGLITIGVGMLLGLFNGLVITRFNVAPFIVTLGTLYSARGLALLINDGATYKQLGDPKLGNPDFIRLGTDTDPWFDLPYSIWIMIGLVIIAVFVTTKTPFGRQTYAIGGNARAAELSGVRVKRTTTLAYVISGFCAAIVGLIVTSQLRSAHPANGEFWELQVIAAVVLGGTSLAGGRGTILGTVIGAFVIGVLRNGMLLNDVSSFWQQVITGLVIVIAVIIDQLSQRLEERTMLSA
ncbi:MAG: ABC transporter permease [Chloroflexi bacterium]|nr:ABC transporter permease [Chloroflexota bacterium]